MIRALVQADVVVVETTRDFEVNLHPEEESLIARAVDKRRREFTTVRHCARTALGRLGLPPVPLLRGERGAPQWPSGVVGSMTHCDGYRAAAVARAEDVLTVGIDAEPHAPLPDGVAKVITTGSEPCMLAALQASWPGRHWDRILFSAKESVYKAWFPLARRWLGFEDAEIVIEAGDGGEGTFTVALHVPGPTVEGSELRGFTGRWTVRAGLALTAITMPTGDVTPH